MQVVIGLLKHHLQLSHSLIAHCIGNGFDDSA